jgi:hypothetical protein
VISGYPAWRYRVFEAKRHWARDGTHTLCGRIHEDAPDSEELFGGSGRDCYALARTKAEVTCVNCLKRLPTRYARLMR